MTETELTRDFNAFLNSESEQLLNGLLIGFVGLEDDVAERRLVAAKIKSLTGLLRWYRERWPDRYSEPQGSSLDALSGQERMRYLWARYLEWLESPPADEAEAFEVAP